MSQTSRPRSRSGNLAAEKLTYAAMLTPALLLLAVFVFIPVALVIYGSLFDFGLTSRDWTFVGLGNYVEAFGDDVFWIALRNNLIIVIGSIVLQVGFGTLLAAVLDRGVRLGRTLMRTIIFAPMVISSVAVGLIWLIILDPNVGPLNAVVKGVGLTPPKLGWLGDPSISIWVVLGIAAWQYTGFMMVLILAGLQAVPKDIYQAAALDGATGLRAFWYITLPSIRNILIVAILITTVGGFKVFDLIFVTTGGGPANSTQVLGTYIYLQAFNIGEMGFANAISVVLLLIAVGLGWLQLKTSRKA
ncbi:carbohydrate ABC transporter membrane protein 1 (CUT1 family) [Aliiruegeria haliotis]|uniref:Carbohydrate ABC transporter membrane protein 1 (CUT1 family) n=1 Tax=Aliiruegeria haliotis TaxID=1280846 RepID=A0A2T0RM10_9RHOB|nr:sugar ABC transporter permease [Aliiruegeria haliotis]PRY22171.1 carbohydrate ABC transporter membrane protein 1 (CUT1 family) [Aliiruegeria haliotis]